MVRGRRTTRARSARFALSELHEKRNRSELTRWNNISRRNFRGAWYLFRAPKERVFYDSIDRRDPTTTTRAHAQQNCLFGNDRLFTSRTQCSRHRCGINLNNEQHVVQKLNGGFSFLFFFCLPYNFTSLRNRFSLVIDVKHNILRTNRVHSRISYKSYLCENSIRRTIFFVLRSYFLRAFSSRF